jgi:hypothetical protein
MATPGAQSTSARGEAIDEGRVQGVEPRGREPERVVGPRTKKERERRIGTSNPVHRIEYWEGWRIFDVVKAETCFELYLNNLIA